jgi:hypothetical protein
MTQHPALELAVRSYVSLLMALGEIGFGWLLVSRSESMVSFFSLGKKSRFSFNARMLAICGWISLAFGCLSIAMFLILMVVIAFQSLWS